MNPFLLANANKAIIHCYGCLRLFSLRRITGRVVSNHILDIANCLYRSGFPGTYRPGHYYFFIFDRHGSVYIPCTMERKR